MLRTSLLGPQASRLQCVGNGAVVSCRRDACGPRYKCITMQSARYSVGTPASQTPPDVHLDQRITVSNSGSLLRLVQKRLPGFATTTRPPGNCGCSSQGKNHRGR